MDVHRQIGPAKEEGVVSWLCGSCGHLYAHEREQFFCPRCEEDEVRMAPASMQRPVAQVDSP